MKHCVPVTITVICVCKTRRELSETGGAFVAPRAPLYLVSLPVTCASSQCRRGYDARGETQFTYSVKAIVIMLLTTARGTTSRRADAFRSAANKLYCHDGEKKTLISVYC